MDPERYLALRYISVEVAYAGKSGQAIIPVRLTEKATVLEAIEASNMGGRFADIPEMAKLTNCVGIFGTLVSLETCLKEGDRVEIYCDLREDPKEARRKRATANPIPRKRATNKPVQRISSAKR